LLKTTKHHLQTPSAPLATAPVLAILTHLERHMYRPCPPHQPTPSSALPTIGMSAPQPIWARATSAVPAQPTACDQRTISQPPQHRRLTSCWPTTHPHRSGRENLWRSTTPATSSCLPHAAGVLTTLGSAHRRLLRPRSWDPSARAYPTGDPPRHSHSHHHTAATECMPQLVGPCTTPAPAADTAAPTACRLAWHTHPKPAQHRLLNRRRW
jgi:hypothetical protein